MAGPATLERIRTTIREAGSTAEWNTLHVVTPSPYGCIPITYPGPYKFKVDLLFLGDTINWSVPSFHSHTSLLQEIINGDFGHMAKLHSLELTS